MKQFRTAGELVDQHSDSLGRVDAAGLAADLTPRELFVRTSQNLWRRDDRQAKREDGPNDERLPGEDARSHFIRTSCNLWKRQGGVR